MRSHEFITESPSPLGNSHNVKVKLTKRQRAMKQVEQMHEDNSTESQPSGRYIEELVVGRRTYYICGIPGNYIIKATGNNRIIVRDLPTIEDARNYFYLE